MVIADIYSIMSATICQSGVQNLICAYVFRFKWIQPIVFQIFVYGIEIEGDVMADDCLAA